MQLYVIDSETAGLNSPVILIQYQLIDTDVINKDDASIILHEVWRTPIDETLELIEKFCDVGCIFFNAVFDWYHLQRLYNCLVSLKRNLGSGQALPEDHIDLFASLELEARDGLCIKPRHIVDLFLFARKGPLQTVSMNRANIIIRKVPNALASSLQKKLDEIIEISDVHFARRKVLKEWDWDIEANKQDPLFSDLTLRFKPSIALKVLAQYVLGFEKTLLMSDVHPGTYPIEEGWNPCALNICPDGEDVGWKCKINTASGFKRGHAWPGVIKHHISHWAFHETARQYATDDITYTRDLFYHFKKDGLQIDDDDSVLAAQVGSTRWRGFAVDIEGIKQLKHDAMLEATKAPKAPRKVWKHIEPYLSDAEKDILGGSTKKTVLEALAEGFEPCMTCFGTGSVERASNVEHVSSDVDQEACPKCHGKGHTDQPHPAAEKALECLNARKAEKEVELYNKLLDSGRFHASFKIIGTFTSRLAGADSLNPQGIKRDKFVRKMFPLAFGDLVLVGGDFMSFEVSIVDAVSNDPHLREELSKCAECKYVWTLDEFASQIDCPNCGKKDDNEPCRQKFHGLFGMCLKPGSTYDDILATKGTDDDWYDRGKRGGFSTIYGGNESTLVDRLGVSEEVAYDAVEWLGKMFPGMKKFRDDIETDYCSMVQPDGIGSRVVWNEPKEYVESLLGHRRYFTLENQICRKLFNLANKLPPHWKEVPGRCVRRDREQTMAGAMMSALYAAAFNIQAKNLRAAANHTIQSTGATITKNLQTRLWGLQPVGVHPWNIELLNVHDEIMTCIRPELKDDAKKIVDGVVQDYRDLIPLIAIGWSSNMQTWADK